MSGKQNIEGANKLKDIIYLKDREILDLKSKLNLELDEKKMKTSFLNNKIAELVQDLSE